METYPPARHNRLLTAIALLLAVVVALQLAILLQRQERPMGWADRPAVSSAPSWWARLTHRFRPVGPSSAAPVTPDTVWDGLHEMEHMHARINRMFEDAIHIPPAPTPSSTAVTNPPAASGAFLDPVRHMQYMRQQIDAMFAGVRQSPDAWRTGFEDGWTDLAVTPGLGIRDTGDAYEITLQLPGFDRSSIRVTLDGSLLDIVAERHGSSSGDRTNATWTARTASRYERRLRLPQAVTRPDHVQATYREDVLRVLVPKARADEQERGRVPVI
jgi:HSP20 family protein